MNKSSASTVSLHPELYSGGIGTLSEKNIHRTLKYMIEPNPAYHEVNLGKIVADIFRNGVVTEIQCANFTALGKKLPKLLECYPVNVVYPIPHRKRIYNINRESGEISGGRLSPKRGSYCDCFYELSRIAPLLGHPNLTLRLILIDMDEYRVVPKIRRRRSRYERVPQEIVDEITLQTPADYAMLLPDLPNPFTQKELERAIHLSPRATQRGLYALRTVGAVERVGKRANAYLYRISTEK